MALLLGAEDKHTHTYWLCVIPLTMQSNTTTGHLREERGVTRTKGAKVTKKMKKQQRTTTQDRNRKGEGRLCVDGAESFSPVHQRFYFLFIHTDVVDCGLLLHGHLLLFLLLVFVILERVWAHWRRFSGHSQADDMGHSERWFVDMRTHTLKKQHTGDRRDLWTNSKSDEARQRWCCTLSYPDLLRHKYTVTQQTNMVTFALVLL